MEGVLGLAMGTGDILEISYKHREWELSVDYDVTLAKTPSNGGIQSVH